MYEILITSQWGINAYERLYWHRTVAWKLKQKKNRMVGETNWAL